MLALTARALGYGSLAVAMVAGVLDGARSIADGRVQVSSLAGVLEAALPRALPAIGSGLSRLVHPILWDPVLKSLLLAPAVPALFMLGLGLLLAGRRLPEAILPPE